MKVQARLCSLTLVLLAAMLLVTILATQPGRAAGPWYVAPGGDDGNDCLSPGAACASINGALAKPGFVISDTILVATGMYTGTGDEVVLLDKDVILSGGWDASFATQSGASTIDGEEVRRGMTVNQGVAAAVERFTFQNGFGEPNGGGICCDGILTLNNCTLSGNASGHMGGAIMILNNGIMSANNCTISGNMAGHAGGGIGKGWGILSLNNCTITGNMAGHRGGGIENVYFETATLQNTIVAGNTASTYGPDCSGGGFVSSGHNLIGDTADCGITPMPGDLLDVDPRLFVLVGSPGYHPLRPGSPAIDACDPAGCIDHMGNPLTTDQRGTPRPLDGDGDGDAFCDIGSYEFDPEHPIVQVYLPVVLRNY